MSPSTIIFYLLAAAIIGGALMAVTSLKIFRSAVFLLFSLIGIAGLYFYLDYEFIAAVQVIVYVGGIVVLIIFSIFLTHGSGEDMKRPHWIRAVFSALAAAFGCILTMFYISQYTFTTSGKPAVEPSAGNIGAQMLSTTEHGYILPFEVVSILLLAAMIGCIVIAIKVKIPPHELLAEKPDNDSIEMTEPILAKTQTEI